LGINNLDVASIAPEREPLTLIINRPATPGDPERLAAAMRRLNAT
jgi:hypothetical protein